MITTGTAIKRAAQSQVRTVIVAVFILVAFVIGEGVYKHCIPDFGLHYTRVK